MRNLRSGRLLVAGLAMCATALGLAGGSASALDDVTPPTVTITSPANGATYGLGSVLTANYRCSDNIAVVSCTGTYGNGARIPTVSLGTKTFSVIAFDSAGNKTKVTATYTIADKTAPTIAISTPQAGASYQKGQNVTAIFQCQDQPGGSGVASCTGTVPNGAFINTSTTGFKSFTVNATDGAGNHSTKTVSYRVTQ